MLVLTRFVGESIIINEDITVTVLGIKGNQAKFGIDAPSDVPVNREEIHNKILAEREKNND